MTGILLAERFESIWDRYPNKDGRKAAEKHFRNSMKTEKDWSDIQNALTNYLANLKANPWKYAKNGSTWFNNWRDWIPVAVMPTTPRPLPKPKPAEEEISEEDRQMAIRIFKEFREKPKNVPPVV